MTAETYIALTGDDLGANKIFRAATASALDTNPVAIAQRGTGAPWLNGIGAIEAITSGSGNWTVPDGVYSIKVTAIGSGGGISGSAASVFGSITGNAGSAGGGGGVPTGGSGGTGSGGDINITGETGGGTTGSEYFRAMAALGGSKGSGSQYIPASGVGGGGAGGTSIKCMAVEPGDLIAYSTGGNGIIIIEY